MKRACGLDFAGNLPQFGPMAKASTLSAPTLKLRGGARHRVLQGHPWVFANEIADGFLLGKPFDGQGIELRDASGRSLGMGLYNSRSQIIWRRYSRGLDAFDALWLRERIQASISRRNDTRFCRLVWSEADGLPGLVIDRFDDVLVVQLLTFGMDRQATVIGEALQEFLAPREILFRNDAPSRALEGLDLKVTTHSGKPVAADWFTIDGIEYRLDLQAGQKTGFYLDQRAQHPLVASYASGRRVLDGCCNQGAFALHCARSGAASVLGIDSAKPAIEAALENAARNALEAEFLHANLFDWFNANRAARFDLIVLDPPSFARNRRVVEGALRGYKELNLRAFQQLETGGILATYCCSQHVDAATFESIVAEAAGDAGREPRLLHRTEAPADHPVLLTMPESRYLKGLILEV